MKFGWLESISSLSGSNCLDPEGDVGDAAVQCCSCFACLLSALRLKIAAGEPSASTKIYQVGVCVCVPLFNGLGIPKGPFT